VKLATPGRPHLTYCTNIHPGESWEEVRRAVEEHVVAVKRRVAPDRPFGVGLRLSARAAATLSAPGELQAFRALLDSHRLYVFTINGFPYGAFHRTRVKEEVYLPDWLDEARLEYTDRLAHLLAGLLPDGLEGSVSTVPGAFKPRVGGPEDVARMATLLGRHVATLARVEAETGKRVSLALEPEPFCHLETVAETVAFFQEALFGGPGAEALAREAGLDRARSEETLRRHLGVCLDACHMAVEFEEPEAAVRRLRGAGIRIPKVQVSAGLSVLLDGSGAEALDALRPFAEGVYLHQVVERGPGGLRRYLDLPEALAAGPAPAADEWRVHFHVPLFQERLGRFANTQDWLRRLLALVRAEAVAPHLEVETYTWEVLPPEHRGGDLVGAIARELQWVTGNL
jgi:sugar phosphate isomerase/epimerase